jgi:glycosyltransferase involved in cell wall biosynthesis
VNVVHVPTTVGGNPQGLSRQLCKLGVCSESWVLQQNRFHYKCDRVIWSPDDGPLSREIKRLSAILQAALRADVIHFNYGSSLANPIPPSSESGRTVARRLLHWLLYHYWDLLQLLELNLYRLAGIPMFVHYQGDDARQGDYSMEKFEVSIAQHVGPDYYDNASDEFKRRSIRRMARFCETIYAVNPDLLHVLPGGSRFVPYCHISLDEWEPVYPSPCSTAPLKIGHAPSNRAAKGTERLEQAVSALRAEGHELELVIVESVSHDSARKLYAETDVVVDQLYAGWYGGLAVEAMALGKPVMVYIRHDDLDYIPEDMRRDLPIVEISAHTIVEKLRDLLMMPREQLHQLGRRSRAYVERWHDPKEIAGQIRADYEAALLRRRTAA